MTDHVLTKVLNRLYELLHDLGFKKEIDYELVKRYAMSIVELFHDKKV